MLVGERRVNVFFQKAASRNSLSFQTLQKYVKNKRQKADIDMHVVIKNTRNKHRLVFTKNEEKKLDNYVITLLECAIIKQQRTSKCKMAKINLKRIFYLGEKQNSRYRLITKIS